MPKELFNQTLLNDPVLPDDNDRIGLGQPGVSGGKNVVWSYLKKLLASTGFTDITDPSTETLDGITNTQQGVNRETASSIFAIRDAIRQIAGAAATFEADPIPQQINNVETSFTFVEEIPSTNPDILEIDGLNNQVIIKQSGIFQFATFLNVSNSSASQDYLLTLRTRDASDNEIITERSLTIPRTGYSGSSSFTFDVQETDVPLTLDFYLQGDAPGTQLTLQELQSTILTGARVNTGGGLGIVGYETNVAIRAITGYGAGNDALNLLTGAWYKFDPAEVAADDDDVYLTPNDIVEPDSGRWVKKQTFAKNVFTPGFSFTGIDNFKYNFGRDATINSVNKAADITELRVGKNGATPTELTAQLPLTILAADIFEFEATYDREKDSFFTLIGTKS